MMYIDARNENIERWGMALRRATTLSSLPSMTCSVPLRMKRSV
jgi:hypothetical protein